MNEQSTTDNPEKQATMGPIHKVKAKHRKVNNEQHWPNYKTWC